MSKFSIIAAITRDYGLGYKNNLPWHKFPLDMKWFREQTTNQTVIMGSKTWKSMDSKPLPNRHNIVLTRSAPPLGADPNVTFTSSLDAALAKISTPKTFVIGGSDIYRQAINHPDCESLLITHVDMKVPADVFFPDITADQFSVSKVHKRGNKGKVTRVNMVGGYNVAEPLTEPVLTENEVPYEIIEYVRSQPYSHPSTTYVGEAGYLKALNDIIEHGELRHDRTGVGTKALFGLQFRYNLEHGFPLLTTKKMFTRGIFGELLWFLNGQTDVSILREQGIHIWDGNSTRQFLDSRGLNELAEWDIGPSYGFQFRHAGATYQTAQTDYSQQPRYDQVEYVINELKTNPHGRRAIINLWNPSDLGKMALPPCLFLYQFWVSEGKYLHCSLYQRSGDMGLGVPFNIASASTLMTILGKLTGLQPRELVHHIGDAHIYSDHIEPLKRQITRIPRPFPILKVQDRDQKRVEDFKLEDFQVEGYQPYPGIKMEMAV